MIAARRVAKEGEHQRWIKRIGFRARTLSLSKPSMRPITSRVLARCSCDHFSSSMWRTMVSIWDIISIVASYSLVVGSVCCE